MTKFDNLIHDEWELRELVRAYQVVGKSPLSYDDAKAILEDAVELRSWLYAENRWKASVEQWLAAEKRWLLTRELLASDPVYQAANRGWLAMREVCNNLDGVDDFALLAPSLQQRYALFAAAVLGLGAGCYETS